MRKSLLAIFMLSLASVGCPRPTEADTRLRFKDVTVSTTRADVGETVTVSWDFQNSNRIKGQSVQGFNLVFSGVVPSQPVVLDASARSFSFQFTGAVTVELACEDADTLNSDAVADLVAFDVNLNEDAFFTADMTALVNDNYPRLGFNATSHKRSYNFSQFVAFFDPPASENGVIDAFSIALPTGNAFRALSLSVNEADNFRLRAGSGYQLMSPFAPELGVANTYVFGGALTYSGESIDIKSDGGVIKGQRGTQLVFEPIFMAVVLRYNFPGETFDLVDIQLGNLNQGLIVTLNTGKLNDTSLIQRGVGSFTAAKSTNGSTIGTTQGNLKSANVGFGVTTIQTDIFDTFVTVDAQWNMPFLFDNNLGGRLQFGPN